jgi:hypothetical protein
VLWPLLVAVLLLLLLVAAPQQPRLLLLLLLSVLLPPLQKLLLAVLPYWCSAAGPMSTRGVATHHHLCDGVPVHVALLIHVRAWHRVQILLLKLQHLQAANLHLKRCCCVHMVVT